MSQSVAAATRFIFGKNQVTELRDDEECWKYCQDRLSLLASLIDGACLFCERNRQRFCEDDPFSFEKRKEGLIFEILSFLHYCCQTDLSELDEKRSSTMLLCLRTLTSLTHDNPVAAQQMIISNEWTGTENGDDDNDEDDVLSDKRGIEILAKLVFELEESDSSLLSSSHSNSQSKDHDMHHYDCTIFCLNTLANVIEAAGVRRILTEIKIVPKSGRRHSISWLEWLCQWYVKQTETFREELMSIGKSNNGKTGGTSSGSSSNNNVARIQEDSHEEMQNHEEEKLVAAGNCCVVLACLMTEPENDDPESSYTIRKMIINQMPRVAGEDDNASHGVAMIINTLKAFCNYYHISLGDLSFAILAPVKKLIKELEELEELDA
jgi:hypothetical protein